ncbi:MAG: nucleoside hydrolase [Acidobacteriota bacterium]|nr:nucleoside hydrolase [Acidobacteriota bacterium]
MKRLSVALFLILIVLIATPVPGGNAASKLSAAAPAKSAARLPVILTTDCGADMDDQWTLAQLAVAPEIELRGVVTTHAPTLAAPAAETSARVVRGALAHMPPGSVRPPVFAGSDVPLPAKTRPLSNAGVSFIVEQSRAFSPERRLVVLVTGAATDVASALLVDETLAERIEIIAMGFEKWPAGGDSWNVKNDPAAWQVILASNVPVTIGDAGVTRRDLTLTRAQARALFTEQGEAGQYLIDVFEAWLKKEAELCRRVTGRADAWPIWDQVVIAHLLNLTRAEQHQRPLLRDDLRFVHPPANAKPGKTVNWITAIDSRRLWKHFTTNLDRARNLLDVRR